MIILKIVIKVKFGVVINILINQHVQLVNLDLNYFKINVIRYLKYMLIQMILHLQVLV